MKKKIIQMGLLLLVSTGLLGACKSSSVADQDVLQSVKNSNQILWGVKNDTKLFGLMDIGSREVKGFDIDIAKAITDKILGRDGNAKFVEITSKTRIPLLKNGNIDAIIATMTISDERKKQVDFSSVYFDAGQSLLVKKGGHIKSVDDLTSEDTVLVVKGATSGANLRKKSPDVKILEMENYSEAFTALRAGQGQAVSTDSAILLGMASDDKNYELAGEPFTKEPYGIAINKGQKAFVEAVNKALEDLHKEGKYDEIYDKWFPNDKSGKTKQ